MLQAKQKHQSIILVVMCACFIYAVSSGVRSNYGILLPSISEHSGVSYAGVSFILAIAQLSYGVMQPISGIIALRKSNHFVLIWGAVMVATGLLMVPFCYDFWSLMLFLGLLMPAGTGMLSFGIIMSAITPVLGPKLAATASGIITAASGLGSTILSPVIQRLLVGDGLGRVMLLLATMASFVILIALWFASFKKEETSADYEQVNMGPMLSQAFNNRSYLYVVIGFFTCGFHMAIIETHLYAQMMSYGIVAETAALIMAAYGIATMLGSVLSGILTSRFIVKWVLGGYYAARVIIILLFFVLPKTTVTLFIFASLLGATGAATVPPASAQTMQLFGARKLGTLFGFAFLLHQVGSFLSSWLGGLLVSGDNGYSAIWISSAILSFIAASVSFMIKTESYKSVSSPLVSAGKE